MIFDNSVVLNYRHIPGKLVDLPSKSVNLYKYLLKLIKSTMNKKDRMKLYFEFLNQCQKSFNNFLKIKSVFLSNQSPIFDLIDIPDNESYLYVCNILNFKIILANSELFKGLILINKHKISENKNLYFNKHNIHRKILSDSILSKRMTIITSLNSKDTLQENNTSNYQKLSIPIIEYLNNDLNKKKRKKEFLSKSFLLSDHLNYNDKEISLDNGFSDNESNKFKAKNILIEKTSNFNKIKVFIHFNNASLSLKTRNLKKQIDVIKQLTTQNNSNNSEEAKEMINKYNNNIWKNKFKLNEYIKNKKGLRKQNIFYINHNLINNDKDKKRINEPVSLTIKENSQKDIFKFKEPTLYDYSLINFLNKPINEDKNHISKNKNKFKNIYFQMDKEINKLYPNLFSFNIHSLLKEYQNFDRRELYEIFSQYKILLKICVSYNKTLKIIKDGIDLSTFHKGVPQINKETIEIAKKIFKSFNTKTTGFLSLEEYLKGMNKIRSNNMEEKIDIFFKIIDNDGNGMLSFDEVYDVSLMSLKRNMIGESKDKNEVVEELAKYFANLIFKLVNVDIDSEIPLEKIKEVIKIIYFNFLRN